MSKFGATKLPKGKFLCNGKRKEILKEILVALEFGLTKKIQALSTKIWGNKMRQGRLTGIIMGDWYMLGCSIQVAGVHFGKVKLSITRWKKSCDQALGLFLW